MKKNPCEALNIVTITVPTKYKPLHFYGYIFVCQNIREVKGQIDKPMKN